MVIDRCKGYTVGKTNLYKQLRRMQTSYYAYKGEGESYETNTNC